MYTIYSYNKICKEVAYTRDFKQPNRFIKTQWFLKCPDIQLKVVRKKNLYSVLWNFWCIYEVSFRRPNCQMHVKTAYCTEPSIPSLFPDCSFVPKIVELEKHSVIPIPSNLIKMLANAKYLKMKISLKTRQHIDFGF